MAALLFTVLGKSVLNGSYTNLLRIAAAFSKNLLKNVLTTFNVMICINCWGEEAQIMMRTLLVEKSEKYNLDYGDLAESESEKHVLNGFDKIEVSEG